MGIGITMPIIANLVPIQQALSKTLRDGLNLLRRSISEISVKITKLENIGVSLPELVAAICLVVCGFLTYYVVPLSLYYKNFSLFSLVLNVIFMAMVLGIVILSTFAVPYVEKVVSSLIFIFFWRDRNLKQVTFSNLKGHKNRNLKTSLMYSIALSFLIMTGCNLAQQKELFSSVVKLFLASDIVALYPYGMPGGLEEKELRSYLEQIKKTTDLVDKYTFISKEYNDAIYLRSRMTLVGPLGGFPLLRLMTYAVEENYLDTVDTDFYYPRDFDNIQIKKLQNGLKDAVNALYSKENLNNTYKSFDDYGILVSEDQYKSSERPSK